MEHVVDRIANCDTYAALHPRLAVAFAFLKRPDLSDLPPGETILERAASGEKTVWAMVQEVRLKPFGSIQRPEVHRRYIDVQAPLSDEETIGLCVLRTEDCDEPFDEGRDVGFKEMVTEPRTLHPGDFAIFFPVTGGHAPCCSLSGGASVKKLVIKILAD